MITTSVAILDVSPPTFYEIQQKLADAGYHHLFRTSADGSVVIDLYGIALRDEDGDDQPTTICIPPPDRSA